MDTKKIIGYVLSVIGIIGIAMTFDFIQKAFSLTLPENSTASITIISLIIFGVGIFFVWLASKGHRHKSKEVPIYHGKEIVGYRRHKK